MITKSNAMIHFNNIIAITRNFEKKNVVITKFNAMIHVYFRITKSIEILK